MKSILSLSAAFVLAAVMAGCSTNGSMKTSANGECCAEGAKSACCAEGKKEGACCAEGKKEGACCSEGKKAEGACCSEKKGEGKSAAVNSKCPYSGNPVNLSIVADYKGRTVAFCCAGCANKWGKEIDADRDAMLAKAMK